MAAAGSVDHMDQRGLDAMEKVIRTLEQLRLEYLETKDKQTWYTMIQLLPSSYNQMRTCTLNYETLANIYFARRSHKLDEWHTYCDWALELPLKVGSLPRVLPIGAVRRLIAGARGRITAGIVIVIVGALTGRRLTVIGRHSAVCGSAERIVLLVHGVVSPLYLRLGS